MSPVIGTPDPGSSFRSGLFRAFAAALLLLPAASARGEPFWTITQLTDNDYEEWSPKVSGPNVVWEGYDGTDSEIFLYDGNATVQITNNSYQDYAPEVSGSNIVWLGHDGNDDEVFLYDGAITQLTNNEYDDYGPDVSGSNVVWTGYDGSDLEIFLYDGVATTQLTDNGYHDGYVAISGSNIVWMGDSGNDYEIFLYDGNATVQITNNSYRDFDPDVSGSNIVWSGDDEIFLYDGASTTQLTNDSYGDLYPQVSDSNVVWMVYIAAPDSDVLLFDGSTTISLTGGDYYSYNQNPHVSGSNVVWSGIGSGTESEIFFYDGTGITQLSINSRSDGDPQVSDATVVWRGSNGNDSEIFMAVASDLCPCSGDMDRDGDADFLDLAPFAIALVEGSSDPCADGNADGSINGQDIRPMVELVLADGGLGTTCGCPGQGNCCESHGNPGCDDGSCCASVCLLYPHCCETGWDSRCAYTAAADPNCDCHPPMLGACCRGDGTCTDGATEVPCIWQYGIWHYDQLCENIDCLGSGCPAPGACCGTHNWPGCAHEPCCQSVCSYDPFCCEVMWDSFCAVQAFDDPNCFCITP